MQFNDNREVKIMALNGGKAREWRDLITRADSGQAISGQIEPVNKAVKLVLSEEAYGYAISNTPDHPFAAIVDMFSSGLVGGLAKLYEAGATALNDESVGTFNPWFKNMPAWKDTSPVKLPLTFSFKLGQYNLWNAREEVAKPLLALLIMALPEYVSEYTMKGPFQSATALMATIIADTAKMVKEGLQAIVSGTGGVMEGLTKVATSLSKAALQAAADYTYTVSIGNQFTLNYAFCTAVDVSFSTDTDQYGYPISGKITMQLEGTLPPALSSSVGSGARFYAGSTADFRAGSLI